VGWVGEGYGCEEALPGEPRGAVTAESPSLRGWVGEGYGCEEALPGEPRGAVTAESPSLRGASGSAILSQFEFSRRENELSQLTSFWLTVRPYPYVIKEGLF
jgi:hypothetical protein